MPVWFSVRGKHVMILACWSEVSSEHSLDVFNGEEVFAAW